MDSPRVVGGKENCTSSSESGWTMYIGSPTREDGDGSDVDEQSCDHSPCVYDENLGSDDSMASDASSGPSNRQETQPFVTDFSNFSAGKKAYKQRVTANNTREAMRSQVGRNDSVQKASTAYSHVRSGARLSKRK